MKTYFLKIGSIPVRRLFWIKELKGEVSIDPKEGRKVQPRMFKVGVGIQEVKSLKFWIEDTHLFMSSDGSLVVAIKKENFSDTWIQKVEDNLNKLYENLGLGR